MNKRKRIDFDRIDAFLPGNSPSVRRESRFDRQVVGQVVQTQEKAPSRKQTSRAGFLPRYERQLEMSVASLLAIEPLPSFVVDGCGWQDG